MSAEALNALTPGNVYSLSEENKNVLNKALNGYLSTVAFIRKSDDGNYHVKPATYSDKKLILNIAIQLNLKFNEI